MTQLDSRPVRTMPPLPMAAAVSGAIAFVLMLIGTYVDTPFKTYADSWGISDTLRADLDELPALALFAGLGVAVIFGAVVSRARRATPEQASVGALVLGIVGVLSIAVFWTGLPVILAAGTATVALDARTRSGHLPRTAGASLVLSSLLTFVAVWAAFAW